MSQLDLVISVCTSTAHLAGALGKPCWVPLDVNPHWVWMLENEESPWYPHTRLFRQSHYHQWEPVLQRLHAALRFYRLRVRPCRRGAARIGLWRKVALCESCSREACHRDEQCPKAGDERHHSDRLATVMRQSIRARPFH
jgi:hypothetical protein